MGFDPGDVVSFFVKDAEDFKENTTRYQVEYAYGLRGSRKDYLMPSCRWMKEHNLCMNCNWGKNPATYTYARAEVGPRIVQRFFETMRRGEKQTRSAN